METLDATGNVLADGDAVHLVKGLTVKGASLTPKRVAVVKNFRLADDSASVECTAGKVKSLMMRAEFLRRA